MEMSVYKEIRQQILSTSIKVWHLKTVCIFKSVYTPLPEERPQERLRILRRPRHVRTQPRLPGLIFKYSRKLSLVATLGHHPIGQGRWLEVVRWVDRVHCVVHEQPFVQLELFRLQQKE